MTVYLIPNENIEKLANKLEILNRKAVKTQSPLVTYTVGEKVVKYYKNAFQFPHRSLFPNQKVVFCLVFLNW